MIISKRNFTDYLFIVLLILNGGTVLKVLGVTASLQAITMVIMMVSIVVNKKIFRPKTGLFLGLVISILLVINFFHYLKFDYYNFFSNQIINFIILIVIGVCFCIQFLGREEIFMSKLSQILKFLIIYGILSWIILTILPTKNVLFREQGEGSAYVGYYYLFFQRIHVLYTGALDSRLVSILGIKLHRAHSLFWEPGVFAGFINFYVFLNFFYLKNIKSLWISIPSMILTWSTAGIIVFLLQSIIFFKDYKKEEKLLMLKKFFLGGIGLGLFFYIGYLNYDNKINGEDSGSAAQRYVDTMGALKIIETNPFLGIGVDFNNLSNQLSHLSVSSSNTGFLNSTEKDEVRMSNSLLRTLVYFGIPLGLFLLYCMYKQTLIPYKRKLLFLIITLTVFSSPILFLPFFFTFIISGLFNKSGLSNSLNLIIK